MLGARGRRSEQLDNVDMLQDLQWPKLKRRARVDICKADIKKKKYDDAGSKKRDLSVVFSEGKGAIEDIVKQASVSPGGQQGAAGEAGQQQGGHQAAPRLQQGAQGQSGGAAAGCAQ